jgi:hypothetical protein
MVSSAKFANALLPVRLSSLWRASPRAHRGAVCCAPAPALVTCVNSGCRGLHPVSFPAQPSLLARRLLSVVERLLHPIARHLCSTKSPNELSCRCRHQMENCGSDTSTSSFVSSPGLQQHRLSLLGACHRSVALPQCWLLHDVSHVCSCQKFEKIRHRMK